MKKWTKWIPVLVAAVVALSGAAISRATIVGSAHDFTYESWNTSQVLCEVCHAPHNAAKGAAQLIPLWGHQTTGATFTHYSSATLNATVGDPSGVSLACLSCHDGTVAINNFGSTSNGTAYVTGQAKLEADLSNDHPISFTYDTALANADGYLWDPSTVVPLLGGKTIAQAMLVGGTVQCSSCHDVHRQKGTSGSSQMLLVISGPSGAGSKLCLTCHNK